MSSVSKRVYQEFLALRNQHEAILRENGRLVHECRLAYLEGVDQGQAELGVSA